MRRSKRPAVRIAVTLAALAGGAWGLFARAQPTEPVSVPKEAIRFDDGDSFEIAWPEGVEGVRLLGIDTPEIQHLDHDIPYDQPFGREAAGFLRGCLAVADEVRLLRSGRQDDYGRTLAYLLLDGKNYSVLALRARLAVETVSHFGDNGLPDEAAACLAAARAAGPVPFESPHRFRARMREVADWLRAQGLHPRAGRREPDPVR